jgi:hypothetical protein
MQRQSLLVPNSEGIEPRMLRGFRFAAVALSVLVTAPAWAQWSRVPALPVSDVFSVWANGDTIAAGADTAVFVSVNAGHTWKRSAKLGGGVTEVRAVWIRNHRLYAGVLGLGVFVSDDLGDTWLDYNQGLVGGFGDSQLQIRDLEVRGDSLYAATDGAHAWVRNLAGSGTWMPFGNAFDSGAMLAIAANDTRLVAAAGFNGDVFFRDRGDADWTLQWLNNVDPIPGLAGLAVIWTGHGWVLGTNNGVFISPPGLEAWTPAGPDFGLLLGMAFAIRDRVLFASFSPGITSIIEFSRDDGATWQQIEGLPTTGVYKMAILHDVLYAGGTNGLWQRSIATVTVPDVSGPARLRFAIAGSQPIGDEGRFRFDLPAPGPVVIEVFDIAGRRAAASIRGSWPAGSNELRWDASGLESGVYLARMTAGGEHAVARVVRVR